MVAAVQAEEEPNETHEPAAHDLVREAAARVHSTEAHGEYHCASDAEERQRLEGQDQMAHYHRAHVTFDRREAAAVEVEYSRMVIEKDVISRRSRRELYISTLPVALCGSVSCRLKSRVVLHGTLRFDYLPRH